MRRAVLLLAFAGCVSSSARPEETRIYHLRSGPTAEWDEFAGRSPHGRDLRTSIDHAGPSAEATLYLRQEGVKQRWGVELNGTKLGSLPLQEEPLVAAFAVPAGVLKAGSNALAVLAPAQADDVLVGVARLDPRPIAASLGDCALQVNVLEAGRGAVPARITVIDDARGALAALRADPSPAVAFRPGVVYAGNGDATIRLPAGRYTVVAGRGFEYGIAKAAVVLEPGQRRSIALEIRREVITPRLVSCDPHVHTLTFSGHGDCTVEERMATIAGEGLELPVATEHNRHAGYREAAAKTGMNRWFTPVDGNEVTTPKAHWNVFPVPAGAPVPNAKLDGDALLKALRATGAVVVLNHPRSRHTNFVPFEAPGFDGAVGDLSSVPPAFHAMELLNSGALRSDFMEVFRDWFALLNRGRRVVAVASSDSHDVSRFVVGQGRTYLACPDEDPADVDVALATKALLEGRAHPSLGLLATIRVAERHGTGDLASPLPEEFPVTVSVWGPSWTHVDRVELFANGVAIKSESQAGARIGGEKLAFTWRIRRPAHDVHLVAVASGPYEPQLHWPMPRPYQPSSTAWTPRWVGATNPVWADADGDGRYSSPRATAERILAERGTEPAKLLAGLRDVDESVAIQAAALLREAGKDLRAYAGPGAPGAVQRAVSQVLMK